MKERNVIILLGPPGSGKGTQARLLSQRKNILHISTGDLFRQNISEETPLGKVAKGYIDAGKLVPDQFVVDMVGARIDGQDCVNGILLDGFPRTLTQAETFGRLLHPDDKVIGVNIDVDDAIITKRAEGRLTCSKCNNTFHRYLSPPKEKGICDNCGGELAMRSDDTLEVIAERLRVYRAQTKAVIGFYERKGMLKTIDGNGSAEEVYQQLEQIYQQFNQSEFAS